MSTSHIRKAVFPIAGLGTRFLPATKAGGEIQLTDAIAADTPANGLHRPVFEGKRFDGGSKQGCLKETVAFALSHPDIAPPFASTLSARLARHEVAA